MEKYSEYLGEGYHKRIRGKMTVDEKLLPDDIIDSDVNIGAMKKLVTPVMETLAQFGKRIDTEKKYVQLRDAALNLLCGILCIAMKSRTSAPPFDGPEYKRNWDKKRDKFIRYGNSQLMELMRMG
jgi:hypothetical protein